MPVIPALRRLWPEDKEFKVQGQSGLHNQELSNKKKKKE
jgi:hypothetical protein